MTLAFIAIIPLISGMIEDLCTRTQLATSTNNEVHGEDFFLKDDLPDVVMLAHTPTCTKFYGTAMPKVILLERAHELLHWC
jgi:hypothetical protein